MQLIKPDYLIKNTKTLYHLSEKKLIMSDD